MSGTGQQPGTCWALVHALCQPLPLPVASEEIKPLPPPAAVNIPTVLEPPSAPLQATSGEIEPCPPSAGVNVQTAPEPPSAPVLVAPEEIEPTPFSAGVNVQTTLEPPTASLPAAVSPRSSPVLWEDWPASHIRQQWMKRLRTETVHLTIGPPGEPGPSPSPLVLTRAQRAHWRLSWKERFARNARREGAPVISITLHGLPASFAKTVALDLVA